MPLCLCGFLINDASAVKRSTLLRLTYFARNKHEVHCKEYSVLCILKEIESISLTSCLSALASLEP